MSNGLYAVAGSKLYIGGQVASKGTVTAADFAGQDWVEIGGWASAGAIGDTQEIIEQTLINEDRVRKIKGVKNGGTFENTFVPLALDAGQKKFREAIESCLPSAFKIEWGGNCAPESVVSFSGSLVSWSSHGLVAGQPVIFAENGGTLPTGVVEGTVYYVIATGLAANAFSISATEGGEAITFTGGTGDVVASAPPAGMTDMFFGLAMSGARSGGEANAVNLRTWSIAVDSNIIEI
jgi:hypothetical protein